MSKEPLTLSYRNGQWTDQFGRKVVNPEAALKFFQRPGFEWLTYDKYEWPGTYEVLYYSDENRVHFEEIKLIAPEPISEHYYIKEFSEGADIPTADEYSIVQRSDFDILYCVKTKSGERFEIWTVNPHKKDLVEFNLQKAIFGMTMRESKRGNSKEGSEPKADHRLIDWPSEEEIKKRADIESEPYQAGFKDAIAWLSSHLQADSNKRELRNEISALLTQWRFSSGLIAEDSCAEMAAKIIDLIEPPKTNTP